MKWTSPAVVKEKAFRVSLVLASVSLLLVFLPFEMQRSASSVIQKVFYSHLYGVSQRLTDLVDVYEINKRLKAEIAEKTLDLTQLREFEKENVRLRDLLGFRESVEYQFIPAEIVALDPKRRQNAVITETSSEFTVSSNLPVVNVDGLVGKTTSVIGDFVTVELLTSPNCRAAARDANTRVLGIIRWTGGGTLLFDNVSLSDTIVVGDTVITSGLGGIFPEDLPIGTVASIGIGDSPFFKTIRVKPFVDFGALDELMILGKGE